MLECPPFLPPPLPSTRPQPLEPLLVSVEEASRLMGLSRRTLFTLRNELAPLQIGGRKMYALDDLRAFIAQRKAGK